jgi:hypothetical protein
MKTIITLLAAIAVAAGASSAMAGEVQASDEAASYTLSHATGWSFGGAYDSVLAPGPARNSTVDAPIHTDFQAGGDN